MRVGARIWLKDITISLWGMWPQRGQFVFRGRIISFIHCSWTWDRGLKSDKVGTFCETTTTTRRCWKWRCWVWKEIKWEHLLGRLLPQGDDLTSLKMGLVLKRDKVGTFCETTTTRRMTFVGLVFLPVFYQSCFWQCYNNRSCDWLAFS